MNGGCGNTCVLQQISLQFSRPIIRLRPVLNAPNTSRNKLLHSRIHAAAAASSSELTPPISSPPPPPPPPSDQQQQLNRVTQWFREYYSLGPHRAPVHAKVEHAAAAFQAASPSRTVLSLEDDILSKAEFLDSLNPGLGWKVFCRYPEEFAHPDAEDSWKILVDLLYTIGFEPAEVSALFFKRYFSILAYTVRDPENLNDLFDWMREIGLSQEDALKMVNRFPRLLQTNVQQQLIPLLAYLEDLGIQRHQAVAILRKAPRLIAFNRSVLSSRVTFLEAEVGLTREEVVQAIISQPQLLTVHPAECMAPAIAFLRDELGCERKLLRRMIVESRLLTSRSIVTIRGRVKMLAEFGIGPELLLQALHKLPRVLLCSLESHKYQKKFEFFKRVMRGSPADLAAFPQYLGYSLPDRIAPRVAAVLSLQQPDTPFYPIGSLTWTLERFVDRYGMTMTEYHAFVEQWSDSDEGKYCTS